MKPVKGFNYDESWMSVFDVHAKLNYIVNRYKVRSHVFRPLADILRIIGVEQDDDVDE